MASRNKQTNDEKMLKKANGGYADYDPGSCYQQRFIIDENEARILNIEPGTYARNDLADEILEKTPNLTSKQASGLSEQNTAAKMRAALNALGLKRK
jgi:hypothetical protein